MNRKKLYFFICVSLVLGTQLTLHKNVVYAYVSNNSGKVDIADKKLNSIIAMSYTIDDTWTVIDTTSIPENETLDKVINDYIADGKTKFYIKNGEYILSESIDINESNVVIQGESKENTKIIQNNSTVNAVTVMADDVEVCNLTIDSSHGRIAFSTSDSQTINNVDLHDCIIYGSPYVYAVAFYGTPYTNDVEDNAVVESGNLALGNTIENNEIHAELSGVSNPEADGILFTKQKGGTISNNKIYGRRIAFYLSRDSQVTNNEIHDSSTNGIRCAVPAIDNEISGNTIDNSKESGISVVRNNGSVSSDYRASNIDIKDNVISNSKYFGIEINNLKDSEISGNKLSDIAFNGIYLVLSDNLNIKENQINNCSLSVSEGSEWGWNESLNSGIFLDSGVKNSNFNNNTISQSKVDTAASKPVACPYGIKIQPENNNSGNTISDNTITGYFADGIDVPETETISENPMNLIPTNLLAEGMGASEIHMSWDSIDDASYNVYRSDSEDGEYIKVNTTEVLSNSYEDTGLEPGKTYYYKVSTGDVLSFSKFASALTWPGVPEGLQGSGLDKSRIQLDWNDIPGVEGYNIYRSDSENGVYSKINTDGITSNTYIDTELDSGRAYYYKITYYYNDGKDESEKSNFASAITLPGIPEGLAVTDIDINKVGLGWNNVLGAQSYNIYRSESETGDYSKIGSTSGTSYENTGLESGKTYYYKITAVNGTGESEKSSGVSAATHNGTPTPALPGVPTGLQASGLDEIRIRLNWNNVSGADSYNIYRSDSETGEYTKVNIAEVTSNTYEDNGLEAGKTYYYKVTAVNGAGESEKSSGVSATTNNETPTPALPGVPTGLQASGLNENSIGLSWDNVSGVQSYNIYRSDSETGEYFKVGNTSGTTYEDTELEFGKTYYYKVTALNIAGESEKSASVSAATESETPPPVESVVPGVPTGPHASGLDESSIRLSWNNVSGADSYNIYRSETEAGEYSKVGSTSGTSYEDTGLESGKTYYYKITAVNGAGESEKSSGVSATTNNETPTPALPGVPTGLQALGLNESSIKLNWDVVSGADSYNIYRSDSEAGEYSKVGSASGTSYENTGLESGKTYYYKITAVNGAGESEKSASASAATHNETPTPALPGVPTGLQASGLDESSIRLSWNNVSGADSYNIYRSETEAGEYSKVGSTSGTSYEDTGLESGKTYYYKVTAVNGAGESERSANAEATTHSEIPVPALPTVPSGLHAEGLDESRIELSWNNVSEATGYNIYRSESETGGYSKIGSTSGTSYEDIGLESRKMYYYKITAVNGAGESEKSSGVSAATHNETPTPALPEVPTGLQASGLNENSIGLSWDNVSGADSYNIYRSDSEVGEYVKVGSTSGTNYENIGLESGKTYYYKVTAVNGAGESEKSASVSAAAKNKHSDSSGGKISETIVKRMNGNNGVETSVLIAEELFKNREPGAAVLASSAVFPDALSGSVLAYKSNAPLLLVGKSLNESREVLDYISSNLGKNKKIYILGGVAAVSVEISNYLNEQGYDIVRLGGKDRYETNYKVADYLNVKKGTPVIIASGNSFENSLGMLSIACIKEYPILISNRNTLSAEAAAYVRNIQPDKVYFIGDTQIAFPDIEDKIHELYENAYITKLTGDDQYKTSVQIMNEFNLNRDVLTITSGKNFQCAIAGSLLAAKNNSNIILVNNDNVKTQKQLLKDKVIKNLLVLGGEDVIDANTIKLLIE
ncbi:MAG: fibronectin type III domain-containing protein [Clostridium sp.]|uniref:fibronectin type III domain-containing protein n=3 Tax=Clostridium sp. TaxID=1506 RepID=UPI0025C257B9|nr:fibronectin type III domain-containing protein [Clostridium sp.]MCH3963530.1 fibronectin type III domain-containing protein [Clostridium sp.]MCI1714671.1 fibronectin type III domain-containing protein [Clostridium sp.]MCI1799140.1 fibronectin type III domain-containing protein [Clostridium sp.]MCI1812854.1 fibronectin type III domain-containing protein [Clostridium sp.]MCI1869744.1 fibronectin type III domain-containing protein [Clostridium sp.]